MFPMPILITHAVAGVRPEEQRRKQLSMRPLLLIGVVVLFLSGTVFALPSCPASQQSIFKSVAGDLRGNGTLLRVRFQQCRMDDSNSAGEYRNGFVIVAKDGSVLADVLAPDPTTMRILDPGQPLDRLWSVPGGAIITLLVEHGARTMDLYAYRFRHGRVTQIGCWKGGAKFEVARLGTWHRLTVIAGQPDRSRLPHLSVWERDRFMPANAHDADIFRAVGKRAARPLLRGDPLPPESFVYDCSVALQAFTRAGDAEQGRHACHLALRRLEEHNGVVPLFPGQDPQRFAGLVTWAQQKIRQILTEPADPSAADDATDPRAHTVIEARRTGHLTGMRNL